MPTGVILTVARSSAGEVGTLLERARAVVFDFDGTLIDSNPIKWAAFERCFGHLTHHRDAVLAYCRANHHVPRKAKFRHIYEQILNEPYTEELETRLCRQFDAATTQAIIDAPAIPGAFEIVRTMQDKITALVSSTPHEVLMRILTARGLAARFAEIQGAPVHKAVWLTAFRQTHRLRAEEIVVFGDTLEDAQAAREADCVFIGVANHRLKPQVEWWVEDFRRLLIARQQ